MTPPPFKLHIYYPMMDVFTLFLPHCLLRSTRYQCKVSDSESVSTVSCPPFTMNPRCHFHRLLWISSVIYTVYYESAVSFLPFTMNLRCHFHRLLWIYGVISTVYYESAVSFPPFTMNLQCHFHPLLWFRCVISTVYYESAVAFPQWRQSQLRSFLKIRKSLRIVNSNYKFCNPCIRVLRWDRIMKKGITFHATGNCEEK